MAAAIRDLPGVEVDIGPTGTGPAGAGPTGIGPAGTGPEGCGPAGTRAGAKHVGADEVEFYVPPFFLTAEAIAVLHQMPKLRVVQIQTAGVDTLIPHIRPGVTLCNARGAHDAGTAEWVVAAILASLREFDKFALAQAAERWDYHFTRCLDGSTVLIVGYGSIGRAVEERLAPFDVAVRRVARTARPGVASVSELAKLLPDADVVVLLAPVTQDTIGMVNADFLARMRDGALLVNAARGSLLVTDALLAELQSGRLHAALDVTDPEPLPPGHPLWTAPNVFITPHVAGSTPASRDRLLRLIREQLARYVRGEPLQNVVAGPY